LSVIGSCPLNSKSTFRNNIKKKPDFIKNCPEQSPRPRLNPEIPASQQVGLPEKQPFTTGIKKPQLPSFKHHISGLASKEL